MAGTVFDQIMRKMSGVKPIEPDASMTMTMDGEALILFTPKPIPPIEVKWNWTGDLGPPPHEYRPRMIKIVWPAPRRMTCGKWRAAGKVYRTKALAWRGLEKRGLRP